MDVWLFGVFASNNNNLDPKKTADRLQARWRSQTKVPEGSQVFGDFGHNYNAAIELNKWVLIGTSSATATVHAVYISDLEYQLRTTEAISDNTRRLKPILNSGLWAATECVTASRIYATRVEFNELTFVPDSTNPNPAPFVKPTPTPKPLVNLGYQSFAEARLELGYDYGAVGGMGYRTEIIEVSDGREQRNATRCLPLGRWQLGNRAIAESSADLLAEVSYLKQFHLDRKGSFQGFRFKDWSDYQAIEQDIAVGDGVKTQFQLRKAYKVGNAVTYRPIQKPVPGTVALFINGVRALDVTQDPVNGWHINNETGVVTGSLASGARLRADFEFDVPVWFESDEIGFRLEAYEPETLAAIYRLESVFVVESPIPPAIPWNVQPLTEITEELDLGIIYDTVEQLSFSTAKQELKSGYTLRQSKRDDSKLIVNLGDRNYDRDEVDKILAYFWNARGSLAEFPFKNLDKSYKVRFDQDQLNFRFEAATDSDKLFNLSGMKLQLNKAIAFEIPPSSIAVAPIIVNPQNPGSTIAASSGNSFYSGSQGIPGGNTAQPYNLSIFKALSVGFNLTAIPGETGTNISYFVAGMFWAANTLHLLITNNSSNSAYNYRLIHYRLSLAGGSWSFEYQAASSQVLRNYIVTSTDINNPKIFHTATGTSSFFRAANTVAFGNTAGYTNLANGLLRFEIKPSGEFEISFLANTLLSGLNWSPPTAVHKDKAWITGSGNYSQLGTFGGITYFKLGGSGLNLGFPIPNLVTPQTDSTWTKASEPDNSHIIYHDTNQLFKYFRRQNNSPSISATTGDDGSYLIKALARGVCETGISGCAIGDSLDLVYFFRKETYDSVPVLIDAQKWLSGSTGGQSYYIQINNGTLAACDRFGNQLAPFGNSLVFYKAGSGYGINIASQMGFSVVNIRNKSACTPYGFAVIAHSSNLFADTVSLAFVQHQDP